MSALMCTFSYRVTEKYNMKTKQDNTESKKEINKSSSVKLLEQYKRGIIKPAQSKSQEHSQIHSPLYHLFVCKPTI